MHGMHRELPANRLQELRESRGLRPYNVAHLLGESTGDTVDPSTIWRWETGRSPIRDDYKFALAELFDVTVAHLMGWDEEAAA